MKDHHRKHDGEGKEEAAKDDVKAVEPHGLSLTAKILIFVFLVWFVQFVRSMLPGDAGEGFKQVNNVLGAALKRWYANLDSATVQHWAYIAAGVIAAAVLVWAGSKVAEVFERRQKKRLVLAQHQGSMKGEDVLGALFGGSKKAAAATVVDSSTVEAAAASVGVHQQVVPVEVKEVSPPVARAHTKEPLPRNEAFVYPARLRSFFLELVAHDWTLERSVDKATQRRGLAGRKALEALASQSEEHRALYDAYLRHSSGQAGNTGSGDALASTGMPMMCVSNERPLLVEDGLQDFFRQLQAHDWFYAQKSEPLRMKGKLERTALEAIARRTPQHMALFRAFRAHQYSGDAWGTPQQPAPVLRSDLSAPPKASRRSSKTAGAEVMEVTPSRVVIDADQPSAQQVVH